jgi:hypothetical protein
MPRRPRRARRNPSLADKYRAADPKWYTKAHMRDAFARGEEPPGSAEPEVVSPPRISSARGTPSIRSAAAGKEAARREAAQREAAQREAAQREAARREAARQEAVRQEAERREAIRLKEQEEAARQEAARQEAAQPSSSDVMPSGFTRAEEAAHQKAMFRDIDEADSPELKMPPNWNYCPDRYGRDAFGLDAVCLEWGRFSLNICRYDPGGEWQMMLNGDVFWTYPGHMTQMEAMWRAAQQVERWESVGKLSHIYGY